MSIPEVDSMSSQTDTRSLAAYSMAEAARYLRLSQSTLRSWVSGRAPITKPRYQEDTPVCIDPEISFGQPVLAGTRVRTAIISDRFIAGDSIVEIANDFDVTVAQVEEAIRWEKPEIAA
jgi:uncharacterized protein (DUF433 family)